MLSTPIDKGGQGVGAAGGRRKKEKKSWPNQGKAEDDKPFKKRENRKGAVEKGGGTKRRGSGIARKGKIQRRVR